MNLELDVANAQMMCADAAVRSVLVAAAGHRGAATCPVAFKVQSILAFDDANKQAMQRQLISDENKFACFSGL